MPKNESKETSKESFSVSPTPKTYRTKLGETGTEEVGRYGKNKVLDKKL